MGILYDFAVWYPCLLSIVKGVFDGQTKHRLKMEEPKQRSLAIIANGPSVLDTIKHLDDAKESMDSMMLNDAYETDLFKNIKPQYYCFADPIDLRPWKEATKYVNTVLENDPEIITIVPSWARDDIGYWKRIKIKKVFISKNPLNSKEYSTSLLKNNYMSPPMWNVSIFALYAGIQLGYKKIYLYGYDMTLYDNVKVNGDNKVVLANNHFYDEEENVTYLHRTMEYLYDAIANNYTAFSILSKYAKTQGVDIINMSPVSKLDMFERYKE